MLVQSIINALDAFFECAHLMADVPFVHFLVIGDGDLRENYQLKYQGLQNLSFVPKIPKSMVQHALSLCDILYFSVFNSRVWDFGQSLNKVVDYMLAGKPIVASYSGFPSMINEARCGSFVHAGDALALRDELLTYAEWIVFSVKKLVFVVENGFYKIGPSQTCHRLLKHYL